MGYHEQKWLQSFEECELVLYRRYVDDIICLFNCESDADKFFVFLNQRHPKIKFTIEKQTENQLSFLDLLITVTMVTIFKLQFIGKSTPLVYTLTIYVLLLFHIKWV